MTALAAVQRDARRPALVGAGLLLLAAVLITVANTGGFQPADTAALGDGVALRSPDPVGFAVLVTTLGNTVAHTLLGLAGGALLWWRGHRADGIYLAVTPPVASLVFTGIKQLLDRARPPAELQVVRETNESLPSGHATMAAAAVTALVLAVWPHVAARARAVLVLLGAAWVTTVGLTRIYLGVHWASDVLAGWTLGAGIAVAGVAVTAFVLSRRRVAG
ncbi:phosphatase PAP2 family protein [Pseudonocardia phyllosphaerae]|uniref:phosphatase PAP2 family protein n=1 Tax=Pseudonocardia phyllosphaerae TaxID=3390502 RepID=UPI003979CD65